MRMTTILSLGKLACGALLAIIISVHLPVILHKSSSQAVVQIPPEVTQQLATSEAQIMELQRRTGEAVAA